MTSGQKTIIYLVRHCQYANPRKVIPFRMAGFPLSASGKKCATELGEFFKDKGISAIQTSPILRAKQTAKIISEALDLKPITSTGLIETDSPLQGINMAQFENKGGHTLDLKSHRQGGGESVGSVFSRCVRVINSTLKNQSEGNVIVVSHGDQIMALIYGLVDGDPKKLFQKTRPYIPMGGVAQLVFKNDQLSEFQRLNY